MSSDVRRVADVQGTGEPGASVPVERDSPATDSRALARFAGRHWLVLVLLAAGAALRVVAVLAYPPALLYIDSYRYLYNLTRLDPSQLDPIGYDLILKPLLAWGGLRLVVLVQHALGLLLAIGVYVLARRYGARNWVAALATAPVLLDAYQVQIEQNIMSDLWLQVLLGLALWVLLRRGGPGPVAAGAAGLLLGMAVLVRTIALPLALPLLGYLVVVGGAWRSRAGWRRIGARAGALLLGFGLVVFCYAGYFHRETGRWGLTGSSDSVLYGRTADIADCATLDLAADLWQLCPPEPLGRRKGVDWYAHLDGDPDWPGNVPAGQTVQTLQHQFAITVIEQQPLDVAKAILGDFAKGFAPGRASSPDDVPVQRWQFQQYYPVWSSAATAIHYTEEFDGVRPGVRLGLAGFLRDYQLGGGYTPGPVLAACALLGLAGSVWRRRSGVRAASLLVTSTGLLVLFASAMFEFSWRYQLPGLVLLPLGGAIGLAGLLGPVRRPVPARPGLAGFPDAADWAALREFTTRYGPHRFPPVLLLCSGAVPDGVPAECLGLGVRVLELRTEPPAEGAGAGLCCVSPASRGPGAAQRLGYRLAGYGGAEYVVTIDERYDPAELPLLLAPLVDGEADLVTGGHRRYWPVALLTGGRTGDADSGFRALRVAVAAALPLREAEHPGAELPLAVLAAGGRVRERPVTVRDTGREHPGMGGALLRTWWRGRLRRPGGRSAESP